MKFIILIIIHLGHFICLSYSNRMGIAYSDYGRIFNMPNDNIHVSAALTEADCVRQCVDFRVNYREYVYDDCFAYNYQFDQFTCELVHSQVPMDYQIGFQTRWKTALKIEL